jgi:molybdenum cofactor cytidylyltransferase
MRGIAGILLAAGAGSRFGGGKLTYLLPDGTPIAVSAAANLRCACEHMVAIVRPDDDELAAQLEAAGCDIVYCPDAAQGMGHSLAAGVRATPDAAAWIVALADMPFIDGSSHQAVASCLRAGASIAATRLNGRRGHPVGFSAKWFTQLAAMTGDQGGKDILQKHPQDLVLCPVDDAGVVLDIDRKEDLASTLHHAMAQRQIVQKRISR